MTDELWIPHLDEPISGLVAEIQQAHPEIGALVAAPRRVLAFRTFAYVRVGMLLGQLLVERDVEPAAGSATWVEQLLADPAVHARVVAEVRAVAEEIAADPAFTGSEPLGPDDAERRRFTEFARHHLAAEG
jgi:hypothetical protein